MTNEAIMVRMPPDLIAALDDFRRAQADLPNRPEAIRRILTDRLNNG
jgi:metal-responsive CopG/Arc/MetJ family transcriptional regulator